MREQKNILLVVSVDNKIPRRGLLYHVTTTFKSTERLGSANPALFFVITESRHSSLVESPPPHFIFAIFVHFFISLFPYKLKLPFQKPRMRLCKNAKWQLMLIPNDKDVYRNLTKLLRLQPPCPAKILLTWLLLLLNLALYRVSDVIALPCFFLLYSTLLALVAESCLSFKKRCLCFLHTLVIELGSKCSVCLPHL